MTEIILSPDAIVIAFWGTAKKPFSAVGGVWGPTEKRKRCGWLVLRNHHILHEIVESGVARNNVPVIQLRCSGPDEAETMMFDLALAEQRDLATVLH
jgi:hypothetical protein